MNIIADKDDKISGMIIEKLKEYKLNESQTLPFFDINNSSYPRSILLTKDHKDCIAPITEELKQSNNTCVIILDAHLDSEDEDDIIPKLSSITKNITIIGARRFTPKELDFITKNKIRHFDMKKITRFGLNDIIDTVMENSANFSNVIVSIDLDVLDPAFADTTFQEPGGFTTRESIHFIQRLKHLKNISLWNLAEYNEKTIDIAAKIVSEMF